LAIFQAWFKDFENQYVLIGGTAVSITMSEAGLPFRGTKDLDMVLHVEVLTPAFGQKFWAFVQAGGYQKKEGDPQQKPCLYRFQKPQDEDFPHMLELFSRVPQGLSFVPPGHLTPIQVGAALRARWVAHLHRLQSRAGRCSYALKRVDAHRFVSQRAIAALVAVKSGQFAATDLLCQ
jgi:hypothetical protein